MWIFGRYQRLLERVKRLERGFTDLREELKTEPKFKFNDYVRLKKNPFFQGQVGKIIGVDLEDYFSYSRHYTISFGENTTIAREREIEFYHDEEK